MGKISNFIMTIAMVFIIVGITIYYIDFNKHPNNYIFLPKESNTTWVLYKTGYGIMESKVIVPLDMLPAYGVKEKFILRTRTSYEKAVLTYWTILYYLSALYLAFFVYYNRKIIIKNLKGEAKQLKRK